MPGDLRHKEADRSLATQLTQAEFDGITAHHLAAQATGDIIYASDANQLEGLAYVADGDLLIGASGLPSWAHILQVETNGLTIGLAAGAPEPDNNALHVFGGSAGAINADADARLIVESNDTVETLISILTPNTARGGLVFEAPTRSGAGFILYYHLNDSLADVMEFGTAQAASVRLSGGATPTMAFQGATTISAVGILALDAVSEIVFNQAGNDVNTRIEGQNNSVLARFEAGADNIGFGVAPNSTTFIDILPGAQSRAYQSNVGGAINLAADTLNATNADGTLAIGAYSYVGIPTLTGDNATLTYTDYATHYIQGPPAAGLNVAVTRPYALWVGAGISRFDGTLQLGLAGSIQGLMNIQGVTSGVVGLTVAAAAGTWTMTLPTAVGTAGFQLTDAAGNGVTSWAAAASRREWKNILSYRVTPQDALDRILGVTAYPFTYKEGYGTGDVVTEYLGVMADEAPWAMHHDGGIFNPINAFGHTVLAFQAHETRIAKLERQLVEAGKIPTA